ncbi:molecular chaperone DnaJ [Phocaeicola faecalis]
MIKMTTEKKYKHPKVALCRYCGGRGYLVSLDEREENEIIKTCPDCQGSGRVVVSAVMEVTVAPYRPEEKTKIPWKD